MLGLILALATSSAAVNPNSPQKQHPHSYSFTTDQLLRTISNGNANADTMLELGRRNDPRILSALESAANGYLSSTRLGIRNYDKAHGTTIEHQPASQDMLQKIELPVVAAAKAAAARQGDQKYFDEFIVGLSSANGRYRRDCIRALGYIGDQSALKYIIPIIDDCGYAYGGPGIGGPRFCSEALFTLKILIPMDSNFKETFPPVKSSNTKTLVDMWRPAIKQWWGQHRSQYEVLNYGKEKSFDYVVNQ